MPHIILEHSSPESAVYDEMLRGLHDCLSIQETIDPTRIKSRRYQSTGHIVGNTHLVHFAHCTVKLMPGRGDGLKKTIAEQMKRVMQDSLAEAAQNETALTLEITELHGSSYQA